VCQYQQQNVIDKGEVNITLASSKFFDNAVNMMSYECDNSLHNTCVQRWVI
jgi:hypothetical protein